MDINKEFQSGFKNVEDIIRAIHPDITDRDMQLVKIQCKSLVNEIITAIGNNTHSLTKKIEI
jgi:hypothetical protein